MSDFQVDATPTLHPEYAATRRLDELRAAEYGHLDERGQVYLDYTGSGVAAHAQLRAHFERLSGHCFGNPHSESPTSSAATALVEEARAAILRFFNASPDEYAVIFTANATGACRLVGEAYPFRRGTGLILTSDNHNSVNGIREFARARGAQVTHLPVRAPDLRVPGEEVRAALGRRRGLFVFPAQSNFTGVQHPLRWIELAHARGYDVLLDAAAFVPANRLDLSRVHPDFVPVSWYKVFGYPTGVGALVARRAALARLRRPWFAGGTIQAVSALGGWHIMARDETAFEDGTLNFLSIPDVEFGVRWIEDIGIDLIHRRVHHLTSWLLHRLTGLRHPDGSPMIVLYGPDGTDRRGGTVAFNVLDRRGRIVDERIIARDTAAAGISIRTGCFCNPGAGEGAFGISERALRGFGFVGRGARSLEDYLGILGLPSGGAVRASLGLVSNTADVERLVTFLEATYSDRVPDPGGLKPRERC
ncbi:MULTISPECIES: aminotransferase class V-fold PLP-dependent enzyme [Actinomadura]|uniref:Aminotransferase class V-fold PLP-dependent enzyme n=1 Tax=Actinomadura litoris TaxID=2678616 RepID=A0A7K1KYG6_9ACTN|nr:MULTISPECIES: aminotransferase class V-fold PLP-dependent enzyme [Actinomadura]MBT2212248.1 aminotransferase class V-fold PLP-dependent enzyme [Actinomadura sp. NEAU-AAG7]MUN37260.1 aminotransferase class V-fold PLP-dependent enzyme [Actinomadura litoris]